MTTSGVYRSWADINAECRLCGWAGDTEICDDTEDNTAIWVCPGCRTEHREVEP